MIKIYSSIFLLMFTNALLAQQTATAKLNLVAQDGFYKIEIPSKIRSISNLDLSDFRILDAQKKDVPYFVLNNNTNVLQTAEFKIISKTQIAKQNTSIIFENSNEKLNQIQLTIANTEVEKNYSISGSNDQTQWFGLVNNTALNLENTEQSTSFSTTIYFPLCNYKFIKIVFDDKKTLPIEVLKISKTSLKFQSEKMVLLNQKNIKWVENKTKKLSTAQIIFDNNQEISQIRFDIKSPKLFRRNCTIYKKVKTIKKHKTIEINETIAFFEINSEQNNVYSLPTINEKEIFVSIENNDNQPLVATIKLYQNPIFVVAQLQKNKNYTINTGNKNLSYPEYDLHYFENKISNQLPQMQIKNIIITNLKNNITQTKPLWQKPWFMWVCIAVGGFAIAYFTTSLIKDMKNN